jgi:hypothetical protein
MNRVMTFKGMGSIEHKNEQSPRIERKESVKITAPTLPTKPDESAPF